MDFNTKSINTSSSRARTNAAKGTTHLQKTKFKNSSSISSNSATQETTSLHPFAVTALDAALLDLSRERTHSQKATYGHDLLDKLEHLRTSILSGNISKEQLLELNQCIINQNSETSDPKLKTILKEIETRVAVELAKFGL